MSVTSTGRAGTLDASLDLQRKAAIAGGGAFDHAGSVDVERMGDFDIGRTIFGGLEGLPKIFMTEKLSREPVWHERAAAEVEVAYDRATAEHPALAIDQRLVDFMIGECDFSMEHADGTFLQHLVFCHDYAARYFPAHSPNVALLHSILGTATNTFAMEVGKITALNELLTDFEWVHVEAFPSILRLFYDGDFLSELEANADRLDRLDTLRMHRVIDNEPLVMDADAMWINLNYHLMHFVDFMPTANWGTHRGDPLLQMFERLSTLLDRADQRRAHVEVSFPSGRAPAIGEDRTMIGRVVDLLPPPLTLKLARKSIRDYSERAGHDLGYELSWR